MKVAWLNKVLPVAIVLLLCGCVYTEQSVSQPVFNIEPDCYVRPNSTDAVCFFITDSTITPMVDVVIYRRVNGYFTLKATSFSQFARPAGIIFSDGGKIVAEVLTEEGHPNFTFYDADNFFSKAEPKSIGHFEDYYLESILTFSDEGVLTYSIFAGDCPQFNHSGLKQNELADYCIRTHQVSKLK